MPLPSALPSLRSAGAHPAAGRPAPERQRELADQLHTTLESLTDGFSILDRDWRIAYANPAAAAMLQLPLEAALGRSFWELFPDVRDTVYSEHYRAAMEQREPRRFEAPYLPLGMWIRVSAFPCDEGIAVSFTDITAARREQDALREMNQELELRVQRRTAQLEAANNDLMAFSYSVAHDLRSPIGLIDGFAQALEASTEQQLGERSRHFLSRIRAAAAGMDAMTLGLLSLFRIGQSELRREPVDLTEIARQQLEAYAAAAPERIVQSCVTPWLQAEADPVLVGMVMQNLLDNAWKYTSTRTRTTIEVGADTVNGQQRFFVKDDGVGFDQSLAGRLFQPFTRLHGNDFPGSGIGLATVQKIITLHGGRIWVRSAQGIGTTVYFTLAPAPAPPPPP